MTEYWVSKQSYFCKYCEIFIRDDKPSRAQHENGLRHKGNLERYIRDIYKKEERTQKEKADEASAISKINEAARIAHEKNDLNQSLADKGEKSGSEENETDAQPNKRMKYSKQDWEGSANLQNYSDARSLGLVDAKVDAETEAASKAEAEKEAREKEGFIGQWQPVTTFGNANQEPSMSRAQNRERLVSKLSVDRDPEKKSIRKLFTERKMEADLDDLEDMEIKLKVDRRSQIQKAEDDDDLSTTAIHGSIRPIRLDGLQNCTYPNESSDSASTIMPPRLKDSPEEDVKPKIDELESPIPSNATAEPSIVFKKRKANKAQLRQKN